MNNKSVVLVDDDPAFRKIIVSLLKTKGLTVIEAGTKKEGARVLSTEKPCLVIVDYALPDGDGVSLVSDLRSAGKNMPIIFISAQFCDAKTFSWLRNILKVSLVLQKPISPELFLQQLDGILPLSIGMGSDIIPELQSASIESFDESDLLSFSESVREEYQGLLQEFPNAKNQFDALLNNKLDTSDAIVLAKLRRLAQKLRVEYALSKARRDYLTQLPGLWYDLSKSISEFKTNIGNINLKQQVINEAHKIKGTAGSYGFAEIGHSAGLIEESIRTIDSIPPAQHALIWTEVASAQSAGENSIKAISKANRDTRPDKQPLKETSILVLSTNDDLRNKIESMQSMQRYRFYFAKSSAEALLRTKTAVLAGAIIDLKSDLDKNYFQLCRELRELPGNNSLPLICIANPQRLANPDELAYLGFSSIITLSGADLQKNLSVSEEEFSAAVNKLMQVRQLNSYRVLIVDDDPEISKFIASLLQGEGMVCHALTEPIEILEEMEHFRPDIVLLDVLMPGLSGYDVCRLLRSNPQWQHIVIFFLTLKQDMQARLAAFSAGADDFLTKPVLGEELIIRVKNHLERSRVRQQKMESDGIAGYASRKTYLNDLDNTLSIASSEAKNGCVCMLAIENFEEIGEKEGFSKQEDILEQFAQLLQCRFKAEVRRCRLRDKIFLLTFPDDNKTTISRVMKFFVDEYNKLSNARLAYAVLEFPQEAKTVADVLQLLHSKIVSGTRSIADTMLRK